MKRNIKIAFPILLVFIGFIAMSFTTGNDSVVLRVNVKKGQTYIIKSKTNSLTTVNAEGMNMSIPQTGEMRQSISIDDVDGDQITTSIVLDAYKMTMTQMGMKLTYDSEHPENNSPMLADETDEIGKNIGKKYTTAFNNRGELVLAKEINSSINQQTCFIIPFPEEPVHVGSQWTQDITMDINNMGIGVLCTYTYMVTEITKKTVTLTQTSTMKGDTELMAMDTNMSSESTIIINRSTGIFTKMTTKTNCSTTIEQQGLKIPMTIITTSEYTVE